MSLNSVGGIFKSLSVPGMHYKGDMFTAWSVISFISFRTSFQNFLMCIYSKQQKTQYGPASISHLLQNFDIYSILG